MSKNKTININRKYHSKVERVVRFDDSLPSSFIRFSRNSMRMVAKIGDVDGLPRKLLMTL